jgi:hypothetical protein
MGCCGKARANLSYARGVSAPATAAMSQTRTATVQQPILRQASGGKHVVMLRYTGKSSIVVRGPATGKQYQFSAGEPIRAVSISDAVVLLRTGYFRTS